jgi:hypothetical protein
MSTWLSKHDTIRIATTAASPPPFRSSTQPTAHSLTVVLARLVTRQSNQIWQPGCKLPLVSYPPPSQKNCQFFPPEKIAAPHFHGCSMPHAASLPLVVVLSTLATGWKGSNWPLGCKMLVIPYPPPPPHPPKIRWYSPLKTELQHLPLYRLSPHLFPYLLIAVSARWETRQSDQICLPGSNLCASRHPHQQKFQKCAQQNAAASPFPGQLLPRPATQRLIVVLLRSTTGWSHHFAMLTPPPLPKVECSLCSLLPQTELPFRPTATLAPSEPPNGCGMLDFFNRNNKSN